MFKRINNRLLTNYPLLWNTRVVWVTAVAVILHILFLVSGFTSTRPGDFKDYYGISSVGGGNLYVFSILCSVAIVLVWLVYLLRNNAFKQFYIIDRWYLLKQFSILVWCLLISLGFFQSYQWGVRFKARMITSGDELVSEVNAVNLAMGFLPTYKSDFFKLNECDSSKLYSDNQDYKDSTMSSYNDSINRLIRSVIDDSDAFSYRHYCSNIQSIADDEIVSSSANRQRRVNWMNRQQRDSINIALAQLFHIADKYRVDYRISTGVLTPLVFATPGNRITRVFNPDEYGNQEELYFRFHELTRALDFIDNCRGNHSSFNDQRFILIVEGYVALCAAILLLSYRLFSRRIFLISVVGTLVWGIVVGLFSISSGMADSPFGFLLFLFFASLGLALLLMKNSSGKTWSGVNLNWHVYLLPFAVMMLMYFVQRPYDESQYNWIDNNREAWEKLNQLNHPIGYWVSQHEQLIIELNLLFVFLYVSFVFTQLAKRWHIQPAE